MNFQLGWLVNTPVNRIQYVGLNGSVIHSIISTIQKTQLRLGCENVLLYLRKEMMTISSHCIFSIEAKSEDCCGMDWLWNSCIAVWNGKYISNRSRSSPAAFFYSVNVGSSVPEKYMKYKLTAGLFQMKKVKKVKLIY